MSRLKKIVLIGGSYNPPHFGHLRLAVEVLEALSPDRLDLIPCSTPPHKEGRGILPFDMRLSMLKEATSYLDNVFINPLENDRDGPSYTWDTLNIYNEIYPDAELFFVIGGIDFPFLNTWYEGLNLPQRARLLVVERSGNQANEFKETVMRFWPNAKPCKTNSKADREQMGKESSLEESITPLAPSIHAAFNIGREGSVQYLPLLRLDISASVIRSLWLAHKNIDFLLPGRIIQTLDNNRKEITKIWS